MCSSISAVNPFRLSTEGVEEPDVHSKALQRHRSTSASPLRGLGMVGSLVCVG